MTRRGVLILALLVLTGCVRYVPVTPRFPVQVEMEGLGPLTAAVVNTTKRPLTAAELPEYHRAGTRWDYIVRFTNPGRVGVRLAEVLITLRSLSWVETVERVPLPSRVEPGGVTPIAIRAALSTSEPDNPANLTGVQELTFRGWTDDGSPLRIVIRVPLE
jgi:hypothetical protein